MKMAALRVEKQQVLGVRKMGLDLGLKSPWRTNRHTQFHRFLFLSQ